MIIGYYGTKFPSQSYTKGRYWAVRFTSYSIRPFVFVYLSLYSVRKGQQYDLLCVKKKETMQSNLRQFFSPAQ